MSNPLSSQTVEQTLQKDQAGKPAVLPVQFIKVPMYTTFEAEFAITEGDLVFHFFKSEETKRLSAEQQRLYWGTTFAAALEPVAKRLFNADFPRLKAQHVEAKDMELDSWWLRAYGFGHLLDPDAIAYRFLDALDEALDAAT